MYTKVKSMTRTRLREVAAAGITPTFINTVSYIALKCGWNPQTMPSEVYKLVHEVFMESANRPGKQRYEKERLASFYEGKVAYWRDMGIHDNPYSRVDLKVQWESGWLQADQEGK